MTNPFQDNQGLEEAIPLLPDATNSRRGSDRFEDTHLLRAFQVFQDYEGIPSSSSHDNIPDLENGLGGNYQGNEQPSWVQSEETAPKTVDAASMDTSREGYVATSSSNLTGNESATNATQDQKLSTLARELGVHQTHQERLNLCAAITVYLVLLGVSGGIEHYGQEFIANRISDAAAAAVTNWNIMAGQASSTKMLNMVIAAHEAASAAAQRNHIEAKATADRYYADTESAISQLKDTLETVYLQIGRVENITYDNKSELKSDIENVRGELKSDIENVRGDSIRLENSMNSKFDSMNSKLDSMNSKFDQVLDSIAKLNRKLDEKLDEKLEKQSEAVVTKLLRQLKQGGIIAAASENLSDIFPQAAEDIAELQKQVRTILEDRTNTTSSS